MSQLAAEYVDVVRIDEDGVEERITVRGEVGFTSLTPIESLQEVIAASLDVAVEEQVVFVQGSEEPLVVIPGVTLRELGIGPSSTIFVSTVAPIRGSEPLQHRSGAQVPPSAALSAALLKMENLNVLARADALENEWNRLLLQTASESL